MIRVPFWQPLRDELAQDTVEYLLAVGAVAVALAIGFQGFKAVIPSFVGHACPAVDTAAVPAPSAGSCITPTP